MKEFIRTLRRYIKYRYFTYGYYIACAVKKGEERAYLRLYIESEERIYPCPLLEAKIKHDAKVDAVVIMNITKVPAYLFSYEKEGFITTLIEGAIILNTKLETNK